MLESQKLREAKSFVEGIHCLWESQMRQQGVLSFLSYRLTSGIFFSVIKNILFLGIVILSHIISEKSSKQGQDSVQKRD